MESVKKSKKELILEAQLLADKFEAKKNVINIALNDLDKKEKIGPEHISGMAIIEDMFNELEQIKLEQEKIIQQIKNS